MNEVTRQLLLAADDARATEFPVGFDRKAEVARLRALLPLVESALGQPMTIDAAVEDASFFADLTTVATEQYMLGSTVASSHLITFRFSCFGRLFTGWKTERGAEDIGAGAFDRARAAICAQGYAFVDEDAIETPYTGSNPLFAGRSWRLRFFDYL